MSSRKSPSHVSSASVNRAARYCGHQHFHFRPQLPRESVPCSGHGRRGADTPICVLWIATIAIGVQIKELADVPNVVCPTYDTGFMFCLLSSLVVFLIRIVGSRRDLLLENLALRQQLVVMKQRYPRPQFSASDT